MTRKTHILSCGAGIILAATSLAPASAATFNSAYTISLYGLTVARSNFATQMDGKNYSISGNLKSAGLAEIFDDTKGTISARGVVAKAGMVPASYVVNYVSGNKNKNTTLGFANGNVVSTSNTPALAKRGNWVEVLPAHLKAVADPLTVLVIKASSLADTCSKTVKAFDGEIRVDMALSPIGETTVDTAGYSGPAMKCALRFMPVSGYRKGKKQIDYLAKSQSISVTFAPMGDTGFYAPVLAAVPTQIGTVSIRASRFEAAN